MDLMVCNHIYGMKSEKESWTILGVGHVPYVRVVFVMSGRLIFVRSVGSYDVNLTTTTKRTECLDSVTMKYNMSDLIKMTSSNRNYA